MRFTVRVVRQLQALGQFLVDSLAYVMTNYAPSDSTRLTVTARNESPGLGTGSDIISDIGSDISSETSDDSQKEQKLSYTEQLLNEL